MAGTWPWEGRLELYRKRVEKSWVQGLNGYQVLRTPTKQSGICFHHHIARAADYRQKIARARGGLPSNYTVLTPPHAAGPFTGKPFSDREPYPNLILEASIALGLPTTVPNQAFHLSEHMYIEKKHIVVARLLEELDEQGPFIVTFYPSTTFPPTPGTIYRGYGKPGSVLHANTVVGYGYEYVLEVDCNGQYYNKEENFFWLVENSWYNYEPYHRLCHSVVQGVYICQI